MIGSATLAPDSDRRYRAYVLFAFILVYTFNFVDRILISIIQEPLRLEFGLSDKELGLLGGPAFAILYSLSAIPIARLAERVNRVTVVAVGLAVWSAMTAVSGLATSYFQLFLARVGVGIGEASCAPSAHAVVSDYFPPESRASAIAVMMLGVPIGTLMASFGGGWVVKISIGAQPSSLWGYQVLLSPSSCEQRFVILKGQFEQASLAFF